MGKQPITEIKEPAMTTKQRTAPAAPAGPDGLEKLRQQYGCGPVEFSGTDDALYERHLLFDDVVCVPDALAWS